MYQSRKGYKAISKALGLQRTMVRAIIHKWRKLVTVVNLPRSGRLQNYICQKILIIPKTFGQIFCGLMRLKLNFLEGACPVTSGVKPTQHFMKSTSYQQSNMVVVVWWSGAALQLQDLDDCHNWWNHEFCTLSENPEGECPVVSLWPQAQAHLGYVAGQWSQTHQQVHLWMVQEKQNYGFGVAKSKSGLKSDWDALAWP